MIRELKQQVGKNMISLNANAVRATIAVQVAEKVGGDERIAQWRRNVRDSWNRQIEVQQNLRRTLNKMGR